MEQLSLFGTEVTDSSNVEMWGSDEFLRVLSEEGEDAYIEALEKRGVPRNVATNIYFAEHKYRKPIIDTALGLAEMKFRSFAFGSGKRAIEANLQSQFGKFLTNVFKQPKVQQAVAPMIAEAGRQWAGEEVWTHTSTFHVDSVKGWMAAVARACEFLEQFSALHGQVIKPSDARIGDELLVTFHGTIYRGWLVKGEIKKYQNGTESISYQLWVQDVQEQGKHEPHWNESSLSEYAEWLSHHPLTKELSDRYVRSFWVANKLYRVGHDDTIKDRFPRPEEVRQALFTLPTPETPEKLWELAKGTPDNWLGVFFKEEWHDMWQEYMKRYTPEDALREISNGACKPSRRGSQYDRLPPDEIIEPMVQALLKAETFEEVQTVLNSYYWIERDSYHTDFYEVCTIDHNCSAYENSHKSALAQTKDRNLIILIMQEFAKNPSVRGRVAKWNQTDGLVIREFPGWADDAAKTQFLNDYEELQKMHCLGLFDRSKVAPDVVDEDDIIPDDDEDCGDGCYLDDEDGEDEE